MNVLLKVKELNPAQMIAYVGIYDGDKFMPLDAFIGSAYDDVRVKVNHSMKRIANQLYGGR